MPPKIRQSSTVFQGKVFAVRIDEVELGPGASARYDVVVHNGAVTLVPVDSAGRIWFVRQYRHPAGEELLELPAGTLEQGEEAETCAVRECREEIGVSPEELTLIGECYHAPGYSTELNRIYLAQGLRPAPLEADEDEALHVEKLSMGEVRQKLADGLVRDAKTLAGLFLAIPYLEAGSELIPRAR